MGSYTNDIKPTMENATDIIANINTNILPDIKNSCNSLPGICDDFITSVDGVFGESLFQSPLPDLPNDIQSNLLSFSSVLADVDQAISAVDIAGQLAGLKAQINSVRAEFDDLLDTVRDVDIFRTSYEIPEFISNNFKYIHIGVLAVGGVLSLVLALVLLGLTCGGCSKSGSGPARTGAGLTCGAFTVFFPLAALLFLLCAVLLLLGGTSEKAVCQSLRQPSESQVFQLADQVSQHNVFNDLFNGTFNLNISEVILGIHNNTPLYPLLSSHLDENWNLETRVRDWREELKVDETVDDFKAKIKKTTTEIVRKSK